MAEGCRSRVARSAQVPNIAGGSMKTSASPLKIIALGLLLCVVPVNAVRAQTQGPESPTVAEELTPNMELGPGDPSKATARNHKTCYAASPASDKEEYLRRHAVSQWHVNAGSFQFHDGEEKSGGRGLL